MVRLVSQREGSPGMFPINGRTFLGQGDKQVDYERGSQPTEQQEIPSPNGKSCFIHFCPFMVFQ